MIKDFARLRKKENNFPPTNTTTRKELNYYGFKTVRPLKIFSPQSVKKLSSMGGSRDSFYYQVPYLDPVGQQIGSFLVDKGWREREFKRINNWAYSPPSLLLKVGERVNFLIRSVG